eukprot:scaffold19670_cov54-Phaeocystis_antarctica.AAC.2
MVSWHEDEEAGLGVEAVRGQQCHRHKEEQRAGIDGSEEGDCVLVRLSAPPPGPSPAPTWASRPLAAASARCEAVCLRPSACARRAYAQCTSYSSGFPFDVGSCGCGEGWVGVGGLIRGKRAARRTYNRERVQLGPLPFARGEAPTDRVDVADSDSSDATAAREAGWSSTVEAGRSSTVSPLQPATAQAHAAGEAQQHCFLKQRRAKV